MTLMRSPSSALRSSAISTREPFASRPTRSIAAWPRSRRESTTFRPGSTPSAFSATSRSKLPMSLTASFLNVGLIFFSPGRFRARLARRSSKRETKGPIARKPSSNQSIWDFRLRPRMAD